MAKKFLAIVLVLLLLLIQPIGARALEQESAEPIIVEPRKHEVIQKLIELRCTICAEENPDINQVLIIDEQLKALGVEELSEEEMADKLGYSGDSARATPGAKTGVTYLSERFVTVWNGERYEIQVITAMPELGIVDSPLKRYPTILFRGEEAQRAKEMQVLGVVARGAYDVASNFINHSYGTAISIGLTFFDMYTGIIDALEESTMVMGVVNSTTINMSYYERYVFVKYDGSPDNGNQILAYRGNKAMYSATIVTPDDILLDGVTYPYQKVATVYETYRAQYYDNYTQRVSQIFWNYRHNGVTNYTQRFWVYNISFTGLGAPEQRIVSPEVGAVFS